MPRNVFVLDKNDITKIIDYGTVDELFEKYGFKSKQQMSKYSNLGWNKDNYTFVFDEESKTEKTLQSEKCFYENQSTKYLVNEKGVFYKFDKENKKKTKMKIYLRNANNCNKTYPFIYLKNEENKRIDKHCHVIVVKCFIDDKYKHDCKTIIQFKDGNPLNLNYKNLEIVSASKKEKRKENIRAKKVRVFKNGKEYGVFDSISEVSKKLYVSRETIRKKIKNNSNYYEYTFEIV